jgi:hypothetical protein
MNNLTENNLPTSYADQQQASPRKGQQRDNPKSRDNSQLNKVHVVANSTIMNTQILDEGSSIQHTSMLPDNFATHQNIIDHEGKVNLSSLKTLAMRPPPRDFEHEYEQLMGSPT